MPAFADITINDGQATPVAHTFKPTSSRDGIFVWHDRASGVALGYPSITYHRKDPLPGKPGDASSNGRVTRQEINVAVPTMETLGTSDNGLTPPPTIAHVHRVNTQWLQPERGNEQERKNLHAYLYNLLNHASFKAVLNQQDGWTGA